VEMSSKSIVQGVKSASERVLDYVRQAPRIKATMLRNNIGAETSRNRTSSRATNYHGKQQKELSVAAKPPLGWYYGDYFRPWHRMTTGDPYNKNIHHRREYPPLSLLELQRLIDLGWLNTKEMIDLTSLCNTKLYSCYPLTRQFGVQLTDEGADIFQTPVNIEVQWASEMAIAAIERAGGAITTAYYDPISLEALTNPQKFFAKGEPIPKRRSPPAELIEYYTNPKTRGYLADPEKLAEARIESAQKYGYAPPEYKDLYLSVKKDRHQIFLGLQPGWIVNLKDECILKPTEEELVKYYQSYE